MSTTFGIPQREVYIGSLIDEDGELYDYINTDWFTPVFFRSYRNSRWLNPIYCNLSEDTRVFALDNSAQGIYTIKDIKLLLNEQYK